MSTLGNFFIFNKVRSWVICIIITLFGIVSYQKLQLRPYPKTGDNDILVEIQSAGSPPDVIENTIGKIVENALASTPGLQKRTSECRYGRYRCFLRFEGLSLIEALYNVQQRIASVRNDLPSQLREPVIRSISKSDEERETIAIAVFDKTGEEDRSSKLAKYAADYKSFFERYRQCFYFR